MRYYSTNRQAPMATLEEAVVKGLAGDKGLYMPERITRFDDEVIRNLKNMSFHEIACMVANAFFGEDIEQETLETIVKDTLSFDTPVTKISDNIYNLELFHGPTLAFKDVGARFMARMLGYFIKKNNLGDVNVLVATSGDTGGAVANGFYDVEGIHVYVLYPKHKVSYLQECQFASLGHNITALEVDGTFDDCQALVKQAFLDEDLNSKMTLTSANSINISRLLPQTFYYFHAYAQLDRIGKADNLVISVPSGNFGNLTAGLIANRMGLPVKKFIAANNSNDVFLEYLKTGVYNPRPSVETLANAMDVGAPSNFARIIDLFGNNEDTYKAICERIAGYSFTDKEIRHAMFMSYVWNFHTSEPHGACGYQALQEYGLAEDETGLYLETAHPVKFKMTVDTVLQRDIEIPERVQKFMKVRFLRVPMDKSYDSFKAYLLAQ